MLKYVIRLVSLIVINGQRDYQLVIPEKGLRIARKHLHFQWHQGTKLSIRSGALLLEFKLTFI